MRALRTLLNLKSSSKDCEWNYVIENDMIKLQIIKGIHDRKTQEILLREPNLTLTQCIDRCKAVEQSNIQLQKIEKFDKLNVDTYEKDINATERDKKKNDCIVVVRCILVISVEMQSYFMGIALYIISTTNTTQNFTIA